MRFYWRLLFWVLTSAAIAFVGPQSALARSCDDPPRAITDFNAKSYYTDAHHSIVDPTLKAESEANEKPVEDFKKGVARNAVAYAKGNAAAGDCAIDWLSQWAAQGAFLGQMGSNQAYYAQKWLLASAALSYARVRDRAAPQARKQIEHWLSALADQVIAHTQQVKERNNHYDWDGLAVGATGAITGNATYLNFAAEVFDTAMGQVQSDGSLPLETARAAKAGQYHSFAASALVMLSSILNRDSPQLDRLVAFTFSVVKDPSIMQRKNGYAQDPIDPKAVEWLRIYRRRHHDPQMAAYEAAQPPHFTQMLGGDPDLPNPLEHPIR